MPRPLVCAYCGKPAVVQCVRCKAAHFCRRKCQKFHWSRGGHKQYCTTVEERAAFDTYANRKKLWGAVYEGDTATALDLLLRGVDANDLDADSVESGATPLLFAANCGHGAVVRALLNAGAETDRAEKEGGFTPLIAATLGGHLAVVRTLLDAGADKEIKDKNGATPLYIAANEGHDAVVRALLDAGADKRHATDGGFTPLSIATQMGHTAIVGMLNP